jgi:hypothetical protein
VGTSGAKSDNGLYINAVINDQKIFLVDSGSTATLMSKTVYDQINSKPISSSNMYIQGVNGSKIKVFGS